MIVRLSFFLVLCMSAAASAVQIASSTIDTHGVVRFAYPSKDTPAIICAPRLMCVIELQAGEQIQDTGSGDSIKRTPDGWIIAKGHQGAMPVIYALPQSPRNVSNLIITTTRRVYSLYLVSAPETSHWHYGFNYLPEASQEVATVAHGDAPPWGTIGRPTPSPSPSPTPLPSDANFFTTGTAPFAPTHVYAQDGVTYLDLPAGSYDWPAVKAIVGEVISPVPSTPDLDHHRLVVQGRFNVLVLWSDEDGTERDVYVSYGRPYTPAGKHHGLFHP